MSRLKSSGAAAWAADSDAPAVAKVVAQIATITVATTTMAIAMRRSEGLSSDNQHRGRNHFEQPMELFLEGLPASPIRWLKPSEPRTERSIGGKYSSL